MAVACVNSSCLLGSIAKAVLNEIDHAASTKEAMERHHLWLSYPPPSHKNPFIWLVITLATFTVMEHPPVPPSPPPWGSRSCVSTSQRGYCADNPSQGSEFCNQVTSCQYGCLLAAHAASLAQCLQWCNASNQPGCNYTAPFWGKMSTALH